MPRDERSDMEAVAENVLEMEDLRVSFYTEEGEVRAVDGVSFSIPRGSIVGLVGESGCGK
jgi:peptide/nickel transport system ATP-binding protein